MVDRTVAPFALEPLSEVPLAKTPLVAVLCQARLPGASAAMIDALKSGDLRSALQAEFPYSSEHQMIEFVMQSGQEPTAKPAPTSALQFYDAQRTWTAGISADSISLSTTAYESRTDFCARAYKLIEAVTTVAQVPAISRLGIRYLNRVSGEKILPSWIEQLNPPGRILYDYSPKEDQPNFGQAMSDLIYRWPDSSIGMQARWGLLAPQSFIDAAMAPIPERSWILDIDTFDESQIDLNAQEISDRLGILAQRAYRFFRWTVSDESIAGL